MTRPFFFFPPYSRVMTLQSEPGTISGAVFLRAGREGERIARQVGEKAAAEAEEVRFSLAEHVVLRQ